MKNVYVDEETGIQVRRINYDSPEETFADIRIIESYLRFVPKDRPHKAFSAYKKVGVIPPKLNLFYQIGLSHRLDHLEGFLKVYALIFDGKIISTPGVYFMNGKCYIHIWVLDSYRHKYADCLKALINYIRRELGKNDVLYFHPKVVDKSVVAPLLKEYVGDFDVVELWKV